MGIVYRARHRSNGREAALKIIEPRPELGISKVELEARFAREIGVLDRVHSARVVEVYAHGKLPDGRLWVAMELAPGAALDTVLVMNGPLSAERTLAVGLELAEALADVHAAGLVHRDIKPGNIVVQDLESHPRLKLVDFGIARALAGSSGDPSQRLTLTGMVLGSLGYMAPEQNTGATEPSPAIDVYAFGVTLFELATGRLPFEGPTAAAFALQHRTKPVPRLSDVLGWSDPQVERLDALLASALAKDPAFRPRDGATLVREVMLALEADPAVRTTVDRVKARVTMIQPAAKLLGTSRRRVTRGQLAAIVAGTLAVTTLVWSFVRS